MYAPNEKLSRFGGGGGGGGLQRTNFTPKIIPPVILWENRTTPVMYDNPGTQLILINNDAFLAI